MNIGIIGIGVVGSAVRFGFERLKSISWSNVIVAKDKVYLIDFGGIPISYTPGGKIKWKVHKKYN